MGIGHIQDVIIGDTRRKGISGGERKRVCVAIELLTAPKLLFLVSVEMCVGQSDGQTNRRTGRQADRQTGRQTGRQADRQAGRQAGRQTGRQADRQSDR